MRAVPLLDGIRQRHHTSVAGCAGATFEKEARLLELQSPIYAFGDVFTATSGPAAVFFEERLVFTFVPQQLCCLLPS